MKILVLSDSHGMIIRAIDAYETVRPDMIIHLGNDPMDVKNHMSSFEDCKFVLVRESIDSIESGAETECVLDIEGVKLFCTHGDLYSVKRDLNALAAAAKSKGCKYALYGHTHVKNVEEVDDVICINPGALYDSGNMYMVFEIENGQLKILD